MTRIYTDILTAYRHDSNVIAAKYDPDISAITAEIGALTIRRHELMEARDVAQAKVDARLAEECHIKVDADGCCVARQGKPRKAAEPPALLPPGGTTEPSIVAGVAEASAILAAPAGEAPTAREQVDAATAAADDFLADVSEPEARLYENGFSAEEVAAMPVAERWTLHRSNAQRKDVAKYPDGWREPIAGEDLPF